MPALVELRHAARTLIRRPGFTVLAITTLALGIGANTAIFSVINRMLLQPLPYEDGERMVFLWQVHRQSNAMMAPHSLELEDLRELQSLERVEAVHAGKELVFAGTDRPSLLTATAISGTLQETLGVRPILGRGFTPEELTDAGPPVVLLSEGLWRREFGQREDIVGGTITLDGSSYTIAGVMPATLAVSHLGSDTDIWLPKRPGTRYFGPQIFAVLRPGMDPARAQRELDLLVARSRQAATESKGVTPIVNEGWDLRLMTAQDLVGDGFRTTLYVLMGAVGIVLLIACANVANLLLVQAIARDRETAIRAALGATGSRLTRQFLAETLLLALAGGIAGTFVAWWGADLIIALRPPSLNKLGGVTLDGRVLAFTLGVTIFTAILFGLPAAVRARTLDLTSRLKGSSGGQMRDRRLLRSALVSGQLALAVVLLVSAGLLVRTLLAYQQVDLGFAPERLLSAQVILPDYRYRTPESQAAFGQQLLERVGALPGVESAALGSGVPPRTGIMFATLGVEGRPETEEGGPGMLAGTSVSGEYFATTGLRVREGRGITVEDTRTDADVMVINQSAAQRFFPGESALGKRVRLSKTGNWSTIVGVVEDVPALGLTAASQPVQLYMPSSLIRGGRVTLIVRTVGDPELMALVLRDVVHGMDTDVPLRAVESVEHQLADTLARPRFNMALLLAFAATALLLTVVGLYGVVSYTVSQRTREIGIRMALGAEPGSVRRMVLTYGLRMTLIGLVVGSLAALAAGRALAGMLHGVTARDPATFAAVAVLLATVSVLACYLPARRATAIDPLQAIRSE